MTFKNISLVATALLMSTSFAYAQGKPSCDEIANPKPGDNCDDSAAAASSDGFLTAGGPLLALLVLGGLAGGGGGTPTTGSTN